jgi:hypothetical protein
MWESLILSVRAICRGMVASTVSDRAPTGNVCLLDFVVPVLKISRRTT